MTSVTTTPFNPLLWLGGPAVACVALSLLFAAPLQIFGLRLPEPVFALAPAFAWGMMRPSFAPPFALLAVGLCLDLLWGTPLGLWPLALLAAYAPVLLARAFLSVQGFWSLWAWYAAACLAALGTGVALFALAFGVVPDLVALSWQLAATIVLFPFANRLIERYEDADARFR